MTHKMLAGAAGVALVLASTVAGAAVQDAWAGRGWEAYSSISMAITGNIITNPTEIVFGNGATMPVQVVADDVQGAWGVGSEMGPATVLRITQPVNPPLVEGNTLCGAQPTYISLYIEPQGGLAMTVYWGDVMPQSSRGDDVCAMYFYGAM